MKPIPIIVVVIFIFGFWQHLDIDPCVVHSHAKMINKHYNEQSVEVFNSRALTVNPSVFEISTRPWLYEMSIKYSRNITQLKDIPDCEFQYIVDQGIDMVWMMGVWKLGEYGLYHDQTDPNLLAYFHQLLPDLALEDIIGSPYSVVEYSLNPALGKDNADLRSLREKLHSLDLALMLDFVPNHSACDCSWINLNPLRYVHAAKDVNPPYDPARFLPSGIAFGSSVGSSPWTDVAQLNYFNLETREAMIDNLMIVASFADAIRCDMAYIILNDYFHQSWTEELDSWNWTKPTTEFWADAIKHVRQKYPDVLFLAEAYGNENEDALRQCGFDYVYDKSILDLLKENNLDNLRSYIDKESYMFSKSCHFIENHDDNRAVGLFGSVELADAASLVTFTLPGMRLHFQGQWHGLKNKLDVHLRRARNEQKNVTAESFYGKFLSILKDGPFAEASSWKSNEILGGGDSWRLIAWSYSPDDDLSFVSDNNNNGHKRLCVVNFSDQCATGNILVNATIYNGNDTIPLVEEFTGVKYWRSAKKIRTFGLITILNPWSAQIFSYH